MLPQQPLSARADIDDKALLGRFADDKDYDLVVSRSTRVVRPDGTTLAVLVKGGLSKAAGGQMYAAVRNRIATSHNRGTAAGEPNKNQVLRDGTLSKTTMSKAVRSSIMGYFDRNPRFPFCRPTAFLVNNYDAYRRCIPALQEADQVFRLHMPQAYARQKAMADKTSSDFVISGTSFTTVTLNKNFRTAYHRDAGDLAEGFGVMTYFRSGRFSGGNLVFPHWRVAIAMESLDVILFDPHEIHGNTDIVAQSAEWERITCVHYYRSNMIACGSAQQELSYAANHDPSSGPRKMRKKLGEDQ